MASKKLWSMTKMTAKLKSYCKAHGLDMDDIEAYPDIETGISYVWDLETPNGHRFKIVTYFIDGSVKIVE